MGVPGSIYTLTKNSHGCNFYDSQGYSCYKRAVLAVQGETDGMGTPEYELLCRLHSLSRENEIKQHENNLVYCDWAKYHKEGEPTQVPLKDMFFERDISESSGKAYHLCWPCCRDRNRDKPYRDKPYEDYLPHEYGEACACADCDREEEDRKWNDEMHSAGKDCQYAEACDLCIARNHTEGKFCHRDWCDDCWHLPAMRHFVGVSCDTRPCETCDHMRHVNSLCPTSECGDLHSPGEVCYPYI